MSKNFYGALSAFAYYECMNRDMPPDEIMIMCCEMTIMGRRGGQLSRLDLNNALVRRILHTLLGLRARRLNRHKEDGSWNNSWGMRINPLHHKEGISVHLVGCPIADFAKRNGYGELIPYFCEADKAIITTPINETPTLSPQSDPPPNAIMGAPAIRLSIWS